MVQTNSRAHAEIKKKLMDHSLSGQTFIVTGANRGIGKVILVAN